MKSRASAAAVLVLALVLAGLAAPSSAHAVIFGFYGSAGLGSSDWHDSRPDNSDHRMDTRHSGVGIVLGTGSFESPLNYRMSIGYEEVPHLGDFDTPDFTMHGVVVDQDLLINLTPRHWQMRVWFGPELRLGYLNGAPDAGSHGDHNYFVIGVGPVLGFDFMVGPAFGLSWKVGYLVSEYTGDNNSWDDGNGDTTPVEEHAYASLSILFSTWGGYREQPPPPPPPPNYPPHW